MITVHQGYLPGAIGRIAELHGVYYAHHWGFTAFFEAKVASGVAEFVNRYHEGQDGLWLAVVNGRIEGSLGIDGKAAQQEGAHLRWFILSDALRGQGIGRQLLQTAIAFCQDKGYPRIYLWTFAGLHSARHLYEAMGFQLMEEHRGQQWGTEVTEQKFELHLR